MEHEHAWVPIRKGFPQQICRCGSLAVQELRSGKNTIITGPAGVGDVIRWTATKAAVALGDIGMDKATGRGSLFVGGSAQAMAVLSDIGGGAQANGGRLSLDEFIPVPIADILAAPSVWWIPYLNNHISLLVSSVWTDFVFTKQQISFSATQTGSYGSGVSVITGLSDTSKLRVGMVISGIDIPTGSMIVSIDSPTQITMDNTTFDSGTDTLVFRLNPNGIYDVFVKNIAGTPSLILGNKWTDDTTRLDGINLVDGGRYVNSGTITSPLTGIVTPMTEALLLGTVRMNNSALGGQSDFKLSSPSSLLLSNVYNQIPFSLFVRDTTDSWDYTTFTWREARGVTSNQVEFVCAIPQKVSAQVVSSFSNSILGSAAVGIGVDSTTTPSGLTGSPTSTTGRTQNAAASYEGMIAPGYHFLAWLEISEAANITTWYGDAGSISIQSGLVGSVMA